MPAGALSLRPATPSDMRFCTDLSRENMAAYLQALGVAWDAQRLAASWDSFENWIILRDQASIGCLRLLPRGADLEVRELQVAAAHRQLGVGTWAIQQAMEIGRQRGFAQLGLRVFVTNPAQRLYRRLGFVEWHRDEQRIHMRAPIS